MQIDWKFWWYYTKLGLFGVIWGLTELIVGFFLIVDLSTWEAILLFLIAHSVSVGMTYLFFILATPHDPRLNRFIMTNDMRIFWLVVSTIPLIGPLILVYTAFFMGYRHLFPARPEDFHRVDMDSLHVLQTTVTRETVPIMKAILIRGSSKEDAFVMMNVINEMEWNFVKSRLLKNMIRLSPFQDVIMMAIDSLTQKLDEVLAQIVELEAGGQKDEATLRKLADLYHEICYLELCDPMMREFYQKRACGYALEVFHLCADSDDETLERKARLEDHARLAAKYLLEADQVREAKEVYDTMRKGNYFFDQWMPHDFKTYMFYVERWISYEFEIYLKSNDKDRFEALYYLIEYEEGVFIPKKVKEAATAWQIALTSASL